MDRLIMTAGFATGSAAGDWQTIAVWLAAGLVIIIAVGRIFVTFLTSKKVTKKTHPEAKSGNGRSDLTLR
ncbi:MAG: hypothetical protein LBU97_00590 [Alistipes sp.]|jgi:hypothetical protein|nr:hypothetical protein [Alistipes sp.]